MGYRRSPDKWEQNYPDLKIGINKESFIGDQLIGPYFFWEQFARRYIKKDDHILSIGSGPCINELALIEKGFMVACSDIKKSKYYDDFQRLFGPFPFYRINILTDAIPQKYDVILCLSVAYLFNKEQLEKFFFQISKGLNLNGRFILDVGGARDSIFAFIWSNFCLKFEKFCLAHVKSYQTGSKYVVEREHHGYRYKDREIVTVAKRYGLVLIDCAKYDFLTEFRRSAVLRNLMGKVELVRSISDLIGKMNPYIRCFSFEKKR